MEHVSTLSNGLTNASPNWSSNPQRFEIHEFATYLRFDTPCFSDECSDPSSDRCQSMVAAYCSVNTEDAACKEFVPLYEVVRSQQHVLDLHAVGIHPGALAASGMMERDK